MKFDVGENELGGRALAASFSFDVSITRPVVDWLDVDVLTTDAPSDDDDEDDEDEKRKLLPNLVVVERALSLSKANIPI